MEIKFFDKKRTRITFFQSSDSRQEREYLSINLVFRDEKEKEKRISQGRARKNEANFHENFREREFLSCSTLEDGKLHWRHQQWQTTGHKSV